MKPLVSVALILVIGCTPPTYHGSQTEPKATASEYTMRKLCYNCWNENWVCFKKGDPDQAIICWNCGRTTKH